MDEEPLRSAVAGVWPGGAVIRRPQWRRSRYERLLAKKGPDRDIPVGAFVRDEWPRPSRGRPPVFAPRARLRSTLVSVHDAVLVSTFVSAFVPALVSRVVGPVLGTRRSVALFRRGWSTLGSEGHAEDRVQGA
ncbi:hypothetical protein [Embleya sp. NPDC050493]|uniref:hypothetical protein n=1 Tax=Embleya sp. NPDC050493 TaxID=3363989 RepID=UPI0037B12D96